MTDNVATLDVTADGAFDVGTFSWEVVEVYSTHLSSNFGTWLTNFHGTRYSSNGWEGTGDPKRYRLTNVLL
jgi:hypothetical protein